MTIARLCIRNALGDENAAKKLPSLGLEEVAEGRFQGKLVAPPDQKHYFQVWTGEWGCKMISRGLPNVENGDILLAIGRLLAEHGYKRKPSKRIGEYFYIKGDMQMVVSGGVWKTRNSPEPVKVPRLEIGFRRPQPIKPAE